MDEERTERSQRAAMARPFVASEVEARVESYLLALDREAQSNEHSVQKVWMIVGAIHELRNLKRKAERDSEYG